MSDLSKLDKNFIIEEAIDQPDVVWHNVRTADVDIYGLYNPRTEEIFRRMPADEAEATSKSVATLAQYTAGGRVRFTTDSEYVAIRMTRPLRKTIMSHITYVGCSGFDIYQKTGSDYIYSGTFKPPAKRFEGYESLLHMEGKKFQDVRKMRDITINMPLYDRVTDLWIGLQKDAVLMPGGKYKYEKPVVYYGNSVTQGGCACRPGTTDFAMLSRELDFDYVNLGFSGSGKGELPMAEYVANMDMSVFVMDYDENSPMEDLEFTHRRMYDMVREKHPKVPIIMNCRRGLELKPSEQKETWARRDIILKNFQRAKDLGDDRVFFLDSREIFKEFGENNCFVDGAHPTDLGFWLIARAMKPILKHCLELSET